jgi:YegS/Rv2252/BmrU family lipid kinase
MNYFIYNPISGNYSKKKRTALLQKINVNSENIVFETSNKDEEYAVTLKAIKLGAKKIIAIGGDGTINKVASALIKSDIPLGIVPMGSGNGLARHLRIPMDPTDALNKALNGHKIKIDACTIDDNLFFCTAGIGFDATVAETFDNRKKRGIINYIIAVIISLFKYEPIEIELESGKKEKIFLMTFANANQYGNNAFISPQSNIQDAQFEIIKIKNNNPIKLLMISLRLFMKNIHKLKTVEIVSSNKTTIKYNAGGPLHIDGESIKTKNPNLQVDILPTALNVIV